MTDAYIGLGSNLDSPIDQIKAAIQAIDAHSDILVEAISSFYDNPPMGPLSQPDFVNAVIKIKTKITALELLAFLQSIEHKQHRQRKVRWGARTIDLDILLYGDAEIQLPNLMIPHIGLVQRAFVVVPLLEISPDLILPNQIQLKKIAQNIDCSFLTKLKMNVRVEKDDESI
jgi:2-amino-4-hydroxy-6-hydroxymethyldihydropteridine diphosphokinase